MKSIRDTNKTYERFLKATAYDSSKLYEESSVFKALKNLNNSPFNQLITNSITEEQLAPEALSFINIHLTTVEREIADELAICHDFNKLSDRVKGILFVIFIHVMGLLENHYGEQFLNYLESTKKEFESVSTKEEVKSLIKNPAGRFNRELLKGYRVITGTNTNLREKPNMKSNVIDRLPIGTLIEIIGTSNRSWLLVEVEINGKIEQGWVLRTYTEYFK